MIVLADPDRGFRARVIEQLGRRDEVLEAEGLAQLEKLLTERGGDMTVAMLGPSLPSDEALRVTQRLQLTLPEVSVIFVAGTLTSDLLQQALRAGVRDVLPDSFTSQQLIDTVARAEMLSRQISDRTGGSTSTDTEKPQTDHKVVTVFSSKGGCGKSFIASNLAILLAQRSE